MTIDLVRFAIEVWVPPKRRNPNIGKWQVIRTSASLEDCLTYVVSCDGERYRFIMNPAALKVQVVK